MRTNPPKPKWRCAEERSRRSCAYWHWLHTLMRSPHPLWLTARPRDPLSDLRTPSPPPLHVASLIPLSRCQVVATAVGQISRAFKCETPSHVSRTAVRLGRGRSQFSTLHMADSSASAEADIQGKVCLVTGGNRGMGLMTARGLLSKGAHVVVTCRDAEGEERAARKLKAFKQVPSQLL